MYSNVCVLLLNVNIRKNLILIKRIQDVLNGVYRTQLQYLRLAESHAAPPQSEQNQLLQPTSLKIQAIQELREKNRSSQLFNHLSAISESIPALGWVTVVSLIIFFYTYFAVIMHILIFI